MFNLYLELMEHLYNVAKKPQYFFPKNEKNDEK